MGETLKEGGKERERGRERERVRERERERESRERKGREKRGRRDKGQKDKEVDEKRKNGELEQTRDITRMEEMVQVRSAHKSSSKTF